MKTRATKTAAFAQALALLEGKEHVTPHHVKRVFSTVISHRLLMQPEARLSGVGPDKVIAAACGSARGGGAR
jgi:MoxR-like ATPase